MDGIDRLITMWLYGNIFISLYYWYLHHTTEKEGYRISKEYENSVLEPDDPIWKQHIERKHLRTKIGFSCIISWFLYAIFNNDRLWNEGFSSYF